MFARLKNLFGFSSSAKQPTSVTVPSGTIAVEIADGPNAGTTAMLDLLTARLGFEPVESKHKCDGADWTVTQPFLADLATTCQSLGVTGCTPTMAYQLWNAINEAFIALKKNGPSFVN